MPTLNWIAKDKIINHHNDVPFKLLDKKYAYGNEESENMIVYGDNLYALKSLLPKYEERIDCVYIDPPYNTGEEKWVYNDNVNDPRIKKWLGQVVGKDGEDLSRHDKWLCMMYPRLKIIYKLMSPKGVIFISIDDNELTNLKLIMDEIFGAHSCLGILPRVTKKSGKDHSDTFAKNHDYVVAYGKTKNLISFNNDEVDDSDYPLRDEYYEERGGYKLNQTLDYDSLWYNPAMDFEIKIGEESFYPGGDYDKHVARHEGNHTPKDWVWRWSLDKFEFGLANGFVVVKQGKGRPRIYTKTYFKASIGKKDGNYFIEYDERTSNASSLEFVDNVYSNDNGKKEMTKLFGSAPFDFPKPSSLIKKLVSLCTDQNSIVLDAFAGSGTTGQAVLELNAEDNGNRTFIEIEMMDYAETITAERARIVINNLNLLNNSQGFNFYELGESILLEDGNLNPNIELADIKQFIYYTETHKNMESNDNGMLMGVCSNVAYYILYKKDCPTCLNMHSLNEIDTKADSYVIYADSCTLSKSFMEKNHIVFKKIPRDIQKI